MKVLAIVFISLFVLTAGAGGYLYKKQHQPLQEELDKTVVAKQNLERDLEDVQTELNQKVAELSKAFQEKEAEIDYIKTTKDSLIAEMSAEINDNQIQITQMADKLKVSIVDKILFPSGETQISPEGLKVLKRVGDILKKSEDKIVRVEGHTDNIPIKGRLQKKYPTNWELSTARATNVVRFLLDEVGMVPERLESVGMGEFHPVAENDTKEGRAQNRRIEIMLLPLI